MTRSACGSSTSRSVSARDSPSAPAASVCPRGTASTPERTISAMYAAVNVVSPISSDRNSGVAAAPPVMSKAPTSGTARVHPPDKSGNGNCNPLFDRNTYGPMRSGSVAAGSSSVITRYHANSWMMSGMLRITST